MPTFTQVFGPVTKEGADWTRWDYKTAAGERYAHFVSTQEIPLNVEVGLELTAKGAIKRWKAASGSENAGNPQAAQESQNGSQAVSAAPTASQRDFAEEARGKTRCQLVSNLLPALFAAQVGKGGEPSPENARVLLDWAFNYVFTPDDLPF